MEFVADKNKVLDAYRIINLQIVQANQQLKKDLRLSEERFNETNDMLLRARQENKTLRDMVRKLKDQLQMVTQVMISVQDHSERVFDMINRPHAMAEDLERNRQVRSHEVYQRMRAENPPLAHEAVIHEKAEEDETVSEDRSKSELEGDNTSTCTTEENETARRSSFDAMEESINRMLIRESSTSACGMLLPSSPLVQRLKRCSKNTSFDESFETIERERVFKLSRHSRERRMIYAGLTETPDSIREVSEDMDIMQCSDRTSALPSLVQEEKPDDTSDMEIEDTLGITLRHISPVKIDEENFSGSSVKTHSEQLPSCYVRPGGHPSRLKKTENESMLSTIYRSTIIREDDNNSSCSYEDTTAYNPEDTIANASCSTPVAKGTGTVKLSSTRTRPRTRLEKTKSESALNRKGKPVVVLSPLTEDNLRAVEQEANRTRRELAAAKGKATKGDETKNGVGSPDWNFVKLEPSSSTENLSVASNESGRPRRKAAPTMLREPSLSQKMRRK